MGNQGLQGFITFSLLEDKQKFKLRRIWWAYHIQIYSCISL